MYPYFLMPFFRAFFIYLKKTRKPTIDRSPLSSSFRRKVYLIENNFHSYEKNQILLEEIQFSIIKKRKLQQNT